MDNATFHSLLETVRRFVREVLVPAEDAVEASDAIPPELVVRMREMGLFGLTIPERWGGLGLYLARRLADLGGGSVSAHSAGVGQGALFEVEWPASREESAP